MGQSDPSRPDNADRQPTGSDPTSSGRRWWPWFPASVALAGVILFIFATHGPPASSSGFVAFLSGLIEPVAPDYVAEKRHYAMLPGPGSWLFAFIVGMAGGGFIARRITRRAVPDVPELWRRRFGPRRGLRFLTTFVAGFLILFASRLAGGCTLGLFMSGTIQLAISGLVFGLLIFLSAMASAWFVYGGRRPEYAREDLS